MTRKTILAAALTAAAILTAFPAFAAHRQQIVTCGRFGCTDNPGARPQASTDAPTRLRTAGRSGRSRNASVRPAVAKSSLGGRPPECSDRRVRELWCGCWLAHRLGFTGALARKLWRARAWATIGHRINGPEPGAIAIYARGRRGGHVGQVTSVVGPGRIILLSGNDGGAVRERERSTEGVIAWVRL